jgi:hypothetical protein
MAKKSKKYSATVAIRAVVDVPLSASNLEEALNTELVMADVASFAGNTVHDYRLDVVGVSEATGWDFLDS